MKRMLNIRVMTLMLLLLIGGAIVNVAVAWGCAVLSGSSENPEAREIDSAKPFALYMRDQPFPGEFRPTLWVYSVENPGEQPIYEWRCVGVRTFHVRCDAKENSDRRATMLVVAAGWPALSLRGEEWRASGAGPLELRLVNAIRSNSLGVRPPTDMMTLLQDDQRLVPLEPLWPGFAINTIFYAGILALLFFAPGRIRRFIRIKRHRCPACGYKIAQGVSAVCSECGTPLPRSLVNESASSAQTNAPP